MGKKADKAKKNEKKEKPKKKEKKQMAKDQEKSQKKSRKARSAATKNHTLSRERRSEMIATAAYYIAERHGFNPARAEQDWREAELQIDAELGGP